ncbi:3'-5' exonuclease [Rubrivivax albus]|uniref:DNA-directed DNA polymerase n=1 Tax=Rubrivivax albus TaxID=2499835 RepID=A0A437JX67_9BURK|nr:exonuclease domain-containing protein [Rubrivivax albus]RVT52229.1 DNA polymerase III subunit epsilon [Rubrivivax albus]
MAVRRDKRLLRWVGVSALALAVVLVLWLGVSAALIGSTMAADERAALWDLLGPRLPLLVLSGALLVAGGAALVQTAYQRWIAAPARLLEQAKAQMTVDRPAPLKPLGQGLGDPTLRELGILVDALLQNRRRLRDDVAAQVAEGSRRVEQERARLAALMSELTQSVVVCNLDGRVLLYNNRARLQFKTLSDAPQLAGGAELIGLGRSIYAVFDRQLVAHALDNIRQRLARGAQSPSAQFVTVTKSGQLLRAQMAAVRDPGDNQTPLGGFVLLLDNITRDYERDAAQDTLLLGLTEGQRASLGNLQAAVEILDDDTLEPAARERFLRVVRDEAARMSAQLQALATRSAEGLKTRWPLEDMLGSDFVAAALRRIGPLGVRTGTLDVDPALWLKVDSFALLQAVATLAQRLIDEFEVKALQLRLQPHTGARGRAQLDLVWSGQVMSTETVMAWESEPMKAAGSASALSVRDVMQRHGGEFWFERDRARHQAFFRFLLPLADVDTEPDAEADLHAESRPEYYDFDLFAAAESQHALDDRRLVELAYTVFDTETTGLQPAEGDEIIQIGAARIVNGKLLRQESFEQLVDPQRSIPEAGIPIHGIRPEMVKGQPTITEVLPAFHTYARDTVLVAHNAAFDMRFLQLKEQATGLRFDQPVLDTLLLSAVVHPNQESHRLEHIAERFGITVVGRHTALGDAMVTAEVFLKLIPLLADQGIHTLGQAREAAQKTWFARLKY